MKIAITLDQVLRDVVKQVTHFYAYDYPESMQPQAGETFLIYGTPFVFPDRDSFHTFLYEDFPLEIFGHADQTYKTAVMDFNRLQQRYGEQVDFLLTDMAIGGRFIPATYYFLSKTACQARQVRFITALDELLPCDMLITASPALLLSAREKGLLTVSIGGDESLPADFHLADFSQLETLLDKTLNP